MKQSVYKRKEIPGNTLSMSQLCFEWSCSSIVIHGYIKAGMPYKTNGDEYEFDLQKCQEWNREGYYNSLNKLQQRAVMKKFK